MHSRQPPVTMELSLLLHNVICSECVAHAVHSHHPLAAMEWSRLLLHDVICSEHITTHFQWGGNLSNLSLVTLTFDLDIQTCLSERSNTFSM